jgi:glycosyltransferase involved in cell wall biosynthesis
MAKLSIIIPARNEPYLRQTVEDIFFNAAGEIEVLVMMDGWEPEEPLEVHSNLKVFYWSEPKGMRACVNELADQATGKYLMKVDAHCAFAEGFDEILKADMEDDWLVTPSRYRLNVKEWRRYDEPIEYLYVCYPYKPDKLYGAGFHGKKWIGMDGIGTNMGRAEFYWPERNLNHVKIDDIQTIQGSLWMCTRDHFMRIDKQDEVHSFFFQEPQEMTFKTWMIGGRCIVNKNTWYAHWHKDIQSKYGMRKTQKHESERFSAWVWMNDKWPKIRKDRGIRWFVNSKFYPMPGWPATWEARPDSNFTVFNKKGNNGFGIPDTA